MRVFAGAPAAITILADLFGCEAIFLFPPFVSISGADVDDSETAAGGGGKGGCSGCSGCSSSSFCKLRLKLLILLLKA